MVFLLEEIGVEAAMVLAVAGSIVCFAYLLAITLIERRELHRAEAARRDAMRTVVLLTRSPRDAFANGRAASPTDDHS